LVEALDTTRKRLKLALWAYVIMPEHLHVLGYPRDLHFEVRLIRSGMKIPVQRKALAFLQRQASPFLNRL
jgi:putative transposase